MTIPEKKFKPSFQRVRYDEERNYIYCGTNTRDIVSFIMPHKKGLRFFVHSRTAKSKTLNHKKITLDCVIPGNYSFEKVTEFIAIHRTMDASQISWGLNLPPKSKKKKPQPGELVYVSKVDSTKRKRILETLRHLKVIQQTLLDSGMWEKRGMSRWKDVPEGFWDYLPIEEYIKSSGRSYNEWWTTYLTKYTDPQSKAILLTPSVENSKDHLLNELAIDREEHDLATLWTNEFEKKYPHLSAEARSKASANNVWSAKAGDTNLDKEALQKLSHFQFYRRRELVFDLIKAGVYPEKLHSIRGWNRLPFSDLMAFVTSTIPTHKQWGLFLNHIYPNFYQQLLAKHNSWTPTRYGQYNPKLMAYLGGMSKQAAPVLNELANLHISPQQLLDFDVKSIPELKRLVEFTTEHQRIQRLKNRTEALNEFYEPPDIELNDGWEWANYITFPRLSKTYSCCISGAWYEAGIAKGESHALYRTDKTTNNGALAYIHYGKCSGWDIRSSSPKSDVEEWHVQEIRGFANQIVDLQYKDYVQNLCHKLNKEFPGKHKATPQFANEYYLNNFFQDANSDPLKKKFLEIMEPQYEEMLNMPTLPVARAERARRDNVLENIFEQNAERRANAPIQEYIAPEEYQDREFMQMLQAV